jgi:hypothetical protein
MTPFFVSSQINAAVETTVKREGFRVGVDLILRQRNKPYMNSTLLFEHAKTVLLPDVDELRTNEEFADKDAVLLMDNCSIHVRPDTSQLLADHRFKVITFPLHTSHIFQSLDVSLFGNFKRKTKYKLPLESEDTTAGFIRRIFLMMKQTLVETNLRSSFRQESGFILDENVLPQKPRFISLWQRE